jgi:hypothetical protein
MGFINRKDREQKKSQVNDLGVNLEKCKNIGFLRCTL